MTVSEKGSGKGLSLHFWPWEWWIKPSGSPELQGFPTCRGLGIVYGDIGTSPLYVFQNIFLEVQPSKNDVLGATSLVLWTIVLIVLIKYSLVVLLADDNGEGIQLIPIWHRAFCLGNSVKCSSCILVSAISRIPSKHPADPSQKVSACSAKQDMHGLLSCLSIHTSRCPINSAIKGLWHFHIRLRLSLLQAEHLLCIPSSVGMQR